MSKCKILNWIKNKTLLEININTPSHPRFTEEIRVYFKETPPPLQFSKVRKLLPIGLFYFFQKPFRIDSTPSHFTFAISGLT